MSVGLSTGCERGCLSRMALDGDASLGTAVAVQQDCPTGMGRCVAGAVEVSVGHAACSSCPCAWRRVLRCDAGCAADGVELARDPLVPETFCRGSSATFAHLPAATAAAATCAGDARFVCRLGTIYACPHGVSAVAVNACTFGCEAEDESLDEPSVDIGAATSLLCRRAPNVGPDGGVAHP